MATYVYRLIHKRTGHFYIGITKQDIQSYWGSGVNLKPEVWVCCSDGPRYNKPHWKKEVLLKFRTKEQASEWERLIVTPELLSNPLCLNVNQGGDSVNKTRDDFRDKNHGKHKKKIDPEITLKALSEVLFGGQTHSQVAKQFNLKPSTVKNIHNHPTYEWARQIIADEIGVPHPGFGERVRQAFTRKIESLCGRAPKLKPSRWQ